MVNQSRPDLDAVFSALSHPVRRHILERLAKGEASVGELAAPFRLSAPAISRHLRVLEQARLVTREREGRVHRLDLAGGPLGAALAWMDRNHRFWSTRLDRLAELLEGPPQSEESSWPPRPPTPARSSDSNARSPRHPRKSSKRSRRPPR